MERIGTLSDIYRYPVKGMAGEALPEAYVAYAGLAGDRVFGFVDRAKHEEGNNFPWFTVRDYPHMLLYKGRFVDAPSVDRRYPDHSDLRVVVETPTGEIGHLDDEDFVQSLCAQFGRDVLLRFSEKGMQDARPISMFGSQTVKQLSDEMGVDLDPLRFRANFYVNWDQAEGFYEDGLVGKHLRIGDRCEVFVQKKDPRCLAITVDPKTGDQRPEILRKVAKAHGGFAGVYCVVIREGVVRQGDEILVLSS